jgi:hypothetical protein
VGIFNQQTEHERAAEAALKAEAQAAAKAGKAAEAFRKSPPGQATEAFERGDRFFQIQLTQETIQSPLFLNPARDGRTNSRRSFNSTDVLGQIEEVGWRLEHTGWVFIEMGHNSTNKVMSSGQWVNVSGQVVGMYLFRRIEPVRPQAITQARAVAMEPVASESDPPPKRTVSCPKCGAQQRIPASAARFTCGKCKEISATPE